MLTIFSIPKAFDGHVGLIQRNAIRSWTALPGCQVVLVGSDSGVADAAHEAGIEHIAAVATGEHGTPRLDDAFRRVEEVARGTLRCFVNADIVLLDDFLPAIEVVRGTAGRFLVVGETTDLEVADDLALDRRDVRDRLAERARTDGRSRGATAIDYFVYTPGLFDPMPPFVVGRARFDNWLVWRARGRGPVVDASRAVLAIHQRHDYAHIEGGQDAAHFGAEAARNFELAGGSSRLFTIFDASHRLDAHLRVRRHLAATLRVRESARKAAWKLRHWR
jgi:hypothetical protein